MNWKWLRNFNALVDAGSVSFSVSFSFAFAFAFAYAYDVRLAVTFLLVKV